MSLPGTRASVCVCVNAAGIYLSGLIGGNNGGFMGVAWDFCMAVL